MEQVYFPCVFSAQISGSSEGWGKDGTRIHDGNIGTEIGAQACSAGRILLSWILLSRLPTSFLRVTFSTESIKARPRSEVVLTAASTDAPAAEVSGALTRRRYRF